MLLAAVGQVPLTVPVEQVLVSADEKGARAAGGVQDAQTRRLLGGGTLQQLANGVLDDVVDDVGRGVASSTPRPTSSTTSSSTPLASCWRVPPPRRRRVCASWTPPAARAPFSSALTSTCSTGTVSGTWPTAARSIARSFTSTAPESTGSPQASASASY